MSVSSRVLAATAIFLLVFSTHAVSSARKGKAAKSKPADPRAVKAPSGFVRMTVAGVMDTKGGNAVVLKEEKEGILLPIWIGDGEAFAIQLRLSRRSYQRPLTHDLLDKVMQKLGGELVKIHVDDLKDNTFLGTVFIRQNDRVISIDARPSDSIALAVGNQAPIFVSRKVLDAAGVKEEKNKEKDPADPENLLKDILDKDREEHTL